MSALSPTHMNTAAANPAESARAASGWRAVVALAVGVTLLRLAYLLWFCPYTLVEDEAHYWEWSRRLEWSYYSKGPGVAWVIAASTRLFEWLGLGLSEAAVRTPAALAGGVLLLAVAGLAGAAGGGARARFIAAAAVLLAPVFWFGSLLMTIDVPYAACWGLAAWCCWLALRRGSRWAWVGMGAALGAGFLFKYTILLLTPALALYALAARDRLRFAPRWGAWAGAGLAAFALGLLPVMIWNTQHDWPTVRHLLGHLSLEGGDVKVWPEDRGWNYSPLWTLELIATQFALIGPVLIVALWAAHRAWRLRRENPEAWTDRLFLILCPLPIFIFYLAVSFIAEPEGNWPLAGHITLLALAGWGAAQAVDEWKARVAQWRALPTPRPWRGFITRRPDTVPRLAWRCGLIVGVIVAVLSLRADLVAASAPMRLVESILKRAGAVPADRPLVPLGRLMGARTMAADADRLMRETSDASGQQAFIVAQQYGRASLLAFYMPGHPTVYCSSSRSDGRRTQYDLWPETSLDDPALVGRPAVLVGGREEEWEPAFAEVRLHGQLRGETKKNRQTFIGLGYRGFPRPGGEP